MLLLHSYQHKYVLIKMVNLSIVQFSSDLNQPEIDKLIRTPECFAHSNNECKK